MALSRQGEPETDHTQAIGDAAPTAEEGDRARAWSPPWSALIAGGHLANPRLAKVHWQAGNCPLPAPGVSVAGESVLWVDPGEILSDVDIVKLGQALAIGRHGDRGERMANPAAYSGLRWGELSALTIPRSERIPVSSPSTARSSRSPGTFTLRPRRTATAAGGSARGAHPAGPCREARNRVMTRRASDIQQRCRPTSPST